MSENLNNDAMDPPVQLYNKQYYTPTEENAILALKELTLYTIELDLVTQTHEFVLQKSFETRYHELYDKRMKFLQELKKNTNGDVTQKFTTFWLQVLKASYGKYISKNDEKVLAHLIDIRWRNHIDPDVKLDIEFHFEPNEYMADSLLTKTYYFKCVPNASEPLLYDGPEIYKCIGCNINWNDKSQNYDTHFFKFFSPPELPDINDANYNNIFRMLQADYKLGIRFKKQIIPKAVVIFTGEIKKVESDPVSTIPFEALSLDDGEQASSLP